MRAVVLVSALFLSLTLRPCPVLALPGGAVEETERNVLLREIALMGGTQFPLVEQDAIRADLLARKYKGANWTGEIRQRIRDAWQRQGYFQADVELVHDVLVETNAQLEVVVVANVEEGQRYRFGEIRWKNISVFSPAQLSALFPLVQGEVFETDKVRQGLEALRKLYSSNGYINFMPVPETEIDEIHGIINLQIDCDEGDQFRLGSVAFHTQNDALKAKFMSSGKLRVGDVYNGALVEALFLENEGSLPEAFTPNECTQIRQDVKAKTVHLRFFLDGPPSPEPRFTTQGTAQAEGRENPAPTLRRRD
jgi:outer membrane translocation and assembly module TamA